MSRKTKWCHDVIEAVTRAGAHLNTIVIPTARSARDVWWVDVLVTQLEAKLNLNKRIRPEVLIEDDKGLANAEAIAVASARIDALIFGVGDCSLSQGARVDTNFVPLRQPPVSRGNHHVVGPDTEPSAVVFGGAEAGRVQAGRFCRSALPGRRPGL